MPHAGNTIVKITQVLPSKVLHFGGKQRRIDCFKPVKCQRQQLNCSTYVKLFFKYFFSVDCYQQIDSSVVTAV